MTDLSLRLPNTRLKAVFHLGAKRAAALPLPARFAEPQLFADWEPEDGISSLFVDFPDGGLHAELRAGVLDSHFHTAAGEETDTSPWPEADSALLVTWGAVLLRDFQELIPDLLDDISEAAAWHEAGFDLYVCEVDEPVQLDLIEVEVQGELMTLPWLGAGVVSNDHIDGDGHRIALYWGHEGTEPDRAIAEAWLDSGTEEPVTRALPGVDWTEIGLPEAEVLEWLSGIYLNHHVIPAAEGTLLDAVLRRMGGLPDLPIGDA
ncbi:hypothetical protein M2152_001379 [Microbacteriaceae bacterium SG_E_30_P1]|uniref:Uncharacterized protein n=1 Tax=Antiquaquibacter oligotrophicus TaxID=2880260 RepID=A0ABT6KQ12_9MICO|nr:hypothetical protein [Antiquaquibacter oligotrophicus]MDH6181197.1 hypothetical protein [Antiquaquibacter oligotrophicus]UDF13108.1 hypothetical protein LH407_13245 [Antiquaquibacter oligotrophicus]